MENKTWRSQTSKWFPCESDGSIHLPTTVWLKPLCIYWQNNKNHFLPFCKCFQPLCKTMSVQPVRAVKHHVTECICDAGSTRAKENRKAHELRNSFRIRTKTLGLTVGRETWQQIHLCSQGVRRTFTSNSLQVEKKARQIIESASTINLQILNPQC